MNLYEIVSIVVAFMLGIGTIYLIFNSVNTFKHQQK